MFLGFSNVLAEVWSLKSLRILIFTSTFVFLYRLWISSSRMFYRWDHLSCFVICFLSYWVIKCHWMWWLTCIFICSRLSWNTLTSRLFAVRWLQVQVSQRSAINLSTFLFGGGGKELIRFRLNFLLLFSEHKLWEIDRSSEYWGWKGRENRFCRGHLPDMRIVSLLWLRISFIVI